MSSTEQISAQLVEIVRQTPGQKILGTRLADALRRDTDFDPIVHGKLGDFVATHVPLVKRMEPRGGDWYYGLEDVIYPELPAHVAAAPEDSATIRRSDLTMLGRAVDGPVWKTYASPATRYRLFGNPQTGELTVIPPGQPSLSPPWIVIPPYPVSAHVEMAKEFVVQISDATKRSILEEVVETSGSGPTSGFYEKVGAVGLGQAWTRFRREKIIAHLASVLRSNRIEFRAVIDSVRPLMPAQSLDRSSTKSALQLHPTADTRQIAIAAIQKMSETELRTLSFPLGYILDIIGNR